MREIEEIRTLWAALSDAPRPTADELRALVASGELEISPEILEDAIKSLEKPRRLVRPLDASTEVAIERHFSRPPLTIAPARMPEVACFMWVEGYPGVRVSYTRIGAAIGFSSALTQSALLKLEADGHLERRAIPGEREAHSYRVVDFRRIREIMASPSGGISPV